MRSDSASDEQYLADLPDDRRAAIEQVRGVILANLPAGFEEAMNWGMICYQVPLDTHPDTYNGRPLMYAALASQKHHMAVYLTGVYADEGRREAFVAEYRKTGKRLDMGKSCVRFRRLDDLPLPLIAGAISAMTVDEFIELVDRQRAR